MKKMAVIGCSGSGRTAFSEGLREKTGLALYSSDAILHKSGKTPITREEFSRATASEKAKGKKRRQKGALDRQRTYAVCG